MVSRDDIMRCIDNSMKSPYDIKRDEVAIGTDWGNQSWGIAGMVDPANPQKIILLDIWDITEAEAIASGGRRDNPHIRKTAEKMRQWQIKRCVFDAGYGKDRNWELMQEFPSRVFSCFYPNLSSDSTKVIEDQWNEADSKVSVDRTMTLKIMAKMFRDGKITIPAWVAGNPLFEIFIKHVTNLVLIRDIETDDKTKKEIIRERVGTLSGGDHFGHAMNYLAIALRKLENAGASDFFF
jgi:hypothetical protein